MTSGLLLDRRSLLVGAGALFAWTHAPRIVSAAGARDPRLLLIILRGGMDGLAAAPPLGDPTYQEERGRFGLALGAGAMPLDGMFALNSQFVELSALFKARQAVFLHAVASPYRGHSHFDGQDVLEGGFGGRPGTGDSGWLNRALERMAPGERLRPPGSVALGPVVPLVMRGKAEVDTWQPKTLPSVQAEMIDLLHTIYAETDPKLAQALEAGAETDLMMAAQMANADRMSAGARPPGQPDFSSQTAAAARLMAKSDGPRIAAMSYYGWDTHAQQGPVKGRLAAQFSALDAAFGALRRGLADAWNDTAVLVVTEFGRTVRINGTLGTDHGTATMAFLIGGAVTGGRVVADWPGLRPQDLLEGRDLRPTLDLRALFKGVLLEHLALSRDVVDSYVFPESRDVAPLTGLCRAA